MTTSRRLSLVFVTLLVAATSVACVTSGPSFESVSVIPSEKALVYIYRPAQFTGSAISYDVRIGDDRIVNLRPGGYFPYLADVGETEFWARTEAKSTAAEQLQPGHTYYLRGGIGMGFFVGHPKLEFVDLSQGEEEVAKCKLLPAKKAPSTEL